MTALARPRKPLPPPNPLMFVAVMLELGILTALIAHGSGVGVLLCVGYSWFSATRRFVEIILSDDE